MLICEEQERNGAKAIQIIKEGKCLNEWYDNVKLWPSFFSGIEVISNRRTPFHKDIQSAYPTYDLLVSAGRHEESWFELPEVGAKLQYKPGTITALCGKALRHGVREWTEGTQRLCFAHFIRDKVHDRLEVDQANYVTKDRYLELVDIGFATRQGWVVGQ
jgi:hypothetical protein